MFVKIETTKEINNSTGEVVENVKTTQVKTQQEPNYIKLYIDHIAFIHKLPKSLPSVIFELLKLMNYEQQIILNSFVKNKIAENLNVTNQHIDNSISKLVKQKILIRIGAGTYNINSFIFGKGNWKNILENRRELKVEIIFDEKNGQTFKTIS